MRIHCQKLRYASDKTFKEKLEIWFIKDHSKAIKFRIFNLILKVLACVLYVLEVVMDPNAPDYTFLTSYKLISNPIPSFDFFDQNLTDPSSLSDSNTIDWNNIFFVKRDPIIRNIQLAIAIYGLCETIFYFYLCYNGNFLDRIKDIFLFIELITTIPWIIEVFVQIAFIKYIFNYLQKFCVPTAKGIYIPVFLNCWLLKRLLNYIFRDFNNINIKHHNSVIGQHLISLGTLFSCLIFTSSCGFHHLQRANPKKAISLFDSLYFIIITFSTVGYGDITPSAWPAKLFMGLMIIVALVVVPTQLEHLASLWFERQNLGASYSNHRAAHERHIVVCSTALQYDLIFDFLNEFYAHRKNQSIHTILLASSELDIQLRSLLHTPLWKQRVFYIHGSALRDNDLERAKVHQAKAVFIIASRGIDKDLADQHSILRSWAIKDFAPQTPQFVQLFRPENKINIKFAEYLVCEDEFKYALLANNCLCPGISTLITLLLHKSTNTHTKEENDLDNWNEHYSRLAGNEIHSIIAENSKFFQEFIGKSFAEASFTAHKKYNVCLIGVAKARPRISLISSKQHLSSNIIKHDDHTKPSNNLQSNNYFNKYILLNPGPNYEIEPHDTCFYISLVKEENYNWKAARVKLCKLLVAVEDLCQTLLVSGPDLTMRRKANEKSNEENSDQTYNVLEAHAEEFLDAPEYQTDGDESSDTNQPTMIPPQTDEDQDSKNIELIIGKPPNPLYIGCNPTLCKLLKYPSHLCCLELNRQCAHKTFNQASDYKWKNKSILVVAEYATNGLFNFILPLRAQVRSIMFLKPIVLLLENPPTIEFLESISCFPLVYWIQGSINNISTILKAGIMDSDTVVVVSPEKNTHINDDSLTDCSNIVSVQNLYRLFPKIKVVAELTKASNIRFMKFRAKEAIKDTSSNMAYMFRLPFASGNVFSASMIDTLLYQTFGKPYLIELLRLLIGISQTPGSGNLTSIPLTEEDMWLKTYGNLYKKLITSTGEIPIGLYRTQSQTSKYIRVSSKQDIHQMIVLKMNKLGIDPEKYANFEDQSEKFSYVLINPNCDVFLKPGDIVYLLKPGTSNPLTKTTNSESATKLPGQMSIKSHNLYDIDEENPDESIEFLESFSLPTSMHSINEPWEDSGTVNNATKKRFSLDNLYRNNMTNLKNSKYTNSSGYNQVSPHQTILELDELKLVDRLNSKNLMTNLESNGKIKSKLISYNNEI